jgi:dipeptidyl-peptidase-4
MLRRFALATTVLLLALGPLAPAARAQQADAADGFTLQAIHASDRFSPEAFEGGKWTAEGPVVTYIEPAGEDTTHLVRYNLESGERTRLIEGGTLYADDVDRLIRIEDYQYSQDGSKVLIYTDSKQVWRYNTKGYYYVYDLEAETLAPIADREDGYQMFAKFNPSATKVAFVRKRNLFVVDLETGRETALTTDGEEGTIINGTFDWVYEEEFNLRDGWRWSPDGNHIAFFKLDESDTREFALTDYRTRYPSYKRFRYPKAGEQNSEIKVGVVDLSAVDPARNGQPQAITYFDTNTWNAGGERHEYIARMDWTPEIDGRHRVWMFRMNRDQNRLDVLYGDPQGGGVETVLQEENDTYISIQEGVGLRTDKLHFLDDGEHFAYLSERTGYNHLHLYRNDGTYLGPVTDGRWEVAGFQGVDEERNLAYFTATRDTSIERQLYRVEVDFEEHASAAAPERISEAEGWHQVNMSKDMRYYIDRHSSSTAPPTWTLHRAGGEPVTVLEDNAELKDRLAALDLPAPEFASIPGADGTPLNAYVVRPNDFSRSREYPVLMYVYGGPGAQTVTRQWGGSRMLWHQYLARTLGVVVVSVDNRGTGGRGKAFQDVPYRRLGQPEAADQIAAAQSLADSSWVDAGRIGIWGWSYGGYMTLMSMLTGEGPDTFAAGLSVAPVTSWRFYDTIYTERYMSTPQNNPEGYDEGAPLTYADRLREGQDLYIAHGDYDDNVHVQNSIRMIEELQAENKQFRFMLYPGHTHSLAGDGTRLHLFTQLTAFVENTLAGQEQLVGAAE